MSNIVAFISVAIALLSLGISYLIYKLSSKGTSYLDIDNQYSELLKLGLETPDLRNYELTSKFYKCTDLEYKKKYEIYAFMCWNLIETIYDQQKDRKGRFHLSETWIPILFIENRLHYSWFKHNSKLFKSGFERFVVDKLNDIEIIDGTTKEMKSLYSNFERDFPKNERKSLNHLETLIGNGKYKLILAKHNIFDEIVGYALVYHMDDPKMIWLDYIAIEERYQNAGFGTLFFNKIIEKEGRHKSGIFIEVEKSDGSEGDKDRRIEFYKRLGAKQLDIDYKLPSTDGGVDMHLYYKSISNDKLLSNEIIKSSIMSAFNYIHTDIEDRVKLFVDFS